MRNAIIRNLIRISLFQLGNFFTVDVHIHIRIIIATVKLFVGSFSSAPFGFVFFSQKYGGAFPARNFVYGPYFPSLRSRLYFKGYFLYELQLNDGLKLKHGVWKRIVAIVRRYFDKKFFCTRQTVLKMARDLQRAYILRAILRYTRSFTLYRVVIKIFPFEGPDALVANEWVISSSFFFPALRLTRNSKCWKFIYNFSIVLILSRPHRLSFNRQVFFAFDVSPVAYAD